MGFEEAIQQLKDAMTVTAGMALRRESRLKEQQERLDADERSIQRHREWLQEHEAAMRELDRKLDRLADLLLRGQ